jgi:Leucine rich repeat
LYVPRKPLIAALVFAATSIYAQQSGAVWDDRSVAEWVLRVGGSVILEGERVPIRDVVNLPSKAFRLHTIDLIDALIQPDEVKNFGGLSHLKELYLSGRTWHNKGNKAATDSFAAMSGLTALEKFATTLPVQTEIPVQDAALAHLATLKNLRELRLEQTQIRGQTLAPFTGLRSLDLRHTRLTDAGMQSLKGLRHLTRLYLRDTLVTDEGLQYMEDLRDLTELDLYGTRSRMPVWYI